MMWVARVPGPAPIDRSFNPLAKETLPCVCIAFDSHCWPP